MLDDIDYSALSAQEPVEQPKKKAGVTSRSVTKPTVKKSVDTEALAEKAQAVESQIGQPEIPDPLAQYGLPALGVLGGLAAAYGAWKQGQKNASYPSTETSVPADNKGAAAIKSVEQNVEQAAVTEAGRLQQLKDRVEAGKQAGLGVQPPAQPGPTYNVPTANVPGMPPAVQAPIQAPVQAPMGAVPAPQTTPAIADAVATGESPAKSIQMDIAKQIEAESVASEAGVKKRAAKTTINFKSPEKLPSDITFRADLGPGDNWLFNTYGPEGRKAILNTFNEGKPAVSYERAKELSQMLQQERVGPAIPRDIAKERGIAPPETNYGKLGKAIKVAGAAGLGLTAAQMAQAAQQAREGDYSAAREFGFNLLGMIPGLASAFNLGTYAPELGAGEQKELAKRKRMAPTID